MSNVFSTEYEDVLVRFILVPKKTMTIGEKSLMPGERNTTPIKWTIRVWKSSRLKQLYA